MALRYERTGIESGQIWRLLTGHFTHLGPSHLWLNVLALLVLAVLLGPWLRCRDWLIVTVTSSLVIDAGLYAFNPGVTWYVGLSGILHGIWAAGCLLALAERRTEALALLALLIGKLVYEAFYGELSVTANISGGAVVTAAHLWGAIGGFVGWIISIATRRLPR